MALINKLSAIGDAIREKTGDTELMTLDAMPAAIRGIETGGGGGTEIEPIVLTGHCNYACAGQLAGIYISLYGDTISTKDITSSDSMFYNYPFETIPFKMNMATGTAYIALSRTFSNARKLKSVPEFNAAYPYNITAMFDYCESLRELPEDFGGDWNWEQVHTISSIDASDIFSNCYSLRRIPETFLSQLWGVQTSGYAPVSGMCSNCFALDELVNIPIHQGKLTSNRFTGMISRCFRLRECIFETNEDGSPKTANWKSQVIDFTSNTGWVNDRNNILFHNSGITADKEVTNDASYQALKNDPDWFSCDVAYSRYNHDSAVNTINSLPDCSATGTNTLKFTGAAGSATDGGAINTLTEEEIAVAAARGWTVTFA